MLIFFRQREFIWTSLTVFGYATIKRYEFKIVVEKLKRNNKEMLGEDVNNCKAIPSSKCELGRKEYIHIVKLMVRI